MSFDGMWSALEPLGRDRRTGGYRRFAWTAADRELREWFAAEAAARGLDVTTDRAGNQWAWWGDPDAAVSAGEGGSEGGVEGRGESEGEGESGGQGRGAGGSDGGVVLGSHLDSVPDGGAYDGALGVVSAFAAVDLLRARGVVPARPIGVVNVADEEGARFGVACAGSRILTGSLAADRALALRDGDGTAMADAMKAAGHDPDQVGPDPRTLRRIGVFVELHVEQGRHLVEVDRPVAVGSSIWPHGRFRLDLPGQADHAGTTLLADRRDPTLALAAAIQRARSAATARGCLATIGKVLVEPNAVNAIPSRVSAWLDVRGEDPAAVRAVVAETAAAAGVEAVEESYTAPAVFDPALAARLAALLEDAPLLATGAGHDAGVLATAGVRAAMLFVRNPTGVSHSPAEFAERADCLAGVEALARAAAVLAG